MISVSTKCTLLVLVLPIGVLLFLTSLIFYIYGVDVFPFISVIWLLFIPSILAVWGKIRDSVSKKLEYLHKNLLFKLYTAFRYDEDIYFGKDEIKRIRSDLGMYGRFVVIPLYPRGLLKRIDGFLSLHGEFYGKLQKINELAEQLIGSSALSRDLLWHFIGLKQERLDTHNPKVVQLHEENCQLIMKEQAQLVDEMKGFLEETKKMRKQIFEKLEDFLKSNNLRLEPEPVYIRP